jgi:hypothetical protein
VHKFQNECLLLREIQFQDLVTYKDNFVASTFNACVSQVEHLLRRHTMFVQIVVLTDT